ncbi:hypothetical protein EV13_2059 [Prochlorococcus sp. MIT 0702]|nr:hypothetical protein EV13_2059 [Prochlorococcus sp. MIT 0702]KGG28218.1 hypothetical protein EV12_0968 [Prochlorococcus sp. MIT 0701]KGG37269.1 hypothetical protein EV14_0061 [Prochlorococcus sp. MIT 0703]
MVLEALLRRAEQSRSTHIRERKQPGLCSNVSHSLPVAGKATAMRMLSSIVVLMLR